MGSFISDLSAILSLVEKRIKFLCQQPNHPFFKGHITYLSGLKDEISEMEMEINQDRQVYLEDELGDVLWDYLCLLQTLSEEKHIDRDRVLQRCLVKFSERIAPDGTENPEKWEIIKQRQKESLEKEHKGVSSGS